MRRNVSLALVLSIGLATGVSAQNKPAAPAAPPPAPAPQGQPAQGQQAQGPGQLTQQQQLQQWMLHQFDANKDGVLSDQEKLVASEVMRRTGVPAFGIEPAGFPGAAQFDKQFDKDGDGKLNNAEKLMAQMAYQRIRNHKHGPVAGPGFGGQAGMAPNGLNPAAAAGAAPAGDKVPALIKRFDKDGDGKLNEEEKAAAQAELKKTKTKEKAEKPAKAK
jgi:Ca2+-binding EF-hand superfamily protein